MNYEKINYPGTNIPNGYINEPIRLSIKFNSDSTYSIKSYGEGIDEKGNSVELQFNTLYKFTTIDSLYLEQLMPAKGPETLHCTFMLYLKIRTKKRYLEMTGKWKTRQIDACNYSGTVYLYRKQKK